MARGLFAALGEREFRLLWLGQTTSVLGDALVPVAHELLPTQSVPSPHFVAHGPPQSMPTSPLSLMPSVQLPVPFRLPNAPQISEPSRSVQRSRGANSRGSHPVPAIGPVPAASARFSCKT